MIHWNRIWSATRCVHLGIYPEQPGNFYMSGRRSTSAPVVIEESLFPPAISGQRGTKWHLIDCGRPSGQLPAAPRPNLSWPPPCPPTESAPPVPNHVSTRSPQLFRTVRGSRLSRKNFILVSGEFSPNLRYFYVRWSRNVAPPAVALMLLRLRDASSIPSASCPRAAADAGGTASSAL